HTRRTVERHDAVGGDRLRATLQRELADRLERHERADQALRRFADQHIAVARLLLQARGDVQRIADAGGIVVADDDLPRVHRDTQADGADDALLPAREVAERTLDRNARTDRS